MIRTFSLCLFVATALAACGGQTPEPLAPSGPEEVKPTATSEVTAPEKWDDDLSMPQKAAFMKAHVVPRMGGVFQAFNSARYAEFGCKTCHGANMKDPNEYLPHLSLRDGRLTAFAERPEVAKFMAEKVVPEMASTLGEPPYDLTTHKGFGCAGCHTVDVK